MKEQLLNLVRDTDNPVLAGNLAREYLQARILLALQQAGAMIPLAFQGGTALRFLFGLPRFSEDLAFALERPERDPFVLPQVKNRIRAQLQREGYEVLTKGKNERAVERLLVTFPVHLYEAGLSPGQSSPSTRRPVEGIPQIHPPYGTSPRNTPGVSDEAAIGREAKVRYVDPGSL